MTLAWRLLRRYKLDMTNTTTEAGIEITTKISENTDALIRETRYARNGDRAVSLEITYAGAAGRAVTYATTDNGGRRWTRYPRKAYRSVTAGSRAADRLWNTLLASLA